MSAYYNSSEVYVFFLRLESNLTEDYFHLASYFKQYCISLVPVTAQELLAIESKNREYVVCLNKNMGTDSVLKRHLKKFLGFSLLSRKFCLFDLSSFSKIEIAPKAEYAKSYFHYQLPVDIEETVVDVALKIYQDRTKKQNWPGGKSVKLPSLVS